MHFKKNRLHKIKYKTERHKMVKRGHATIYLLFMLLKLLWRFNFILQLSLSLSLSLLSLYYKCIFFAFCLYHISATTSCNLSHQRLFCVSSFTHIFGMRQVLRQKIDFYRYITFYGYGYNIQHSPLNIYFFEFFQHQFR